MIQVAVVGAGRWGQNLVRTFDALEDAHLRVICDASERVRTRMTALYPGTIVTERFESVLEDAEIDAVAIAVDAPLHHAFAKATLEADKHTYVEKPLTLSSAHASELVDLSAARQRVLMVGHLLKYHPCINYLKQILGSGEIGDLLYLYSQRVNFGIVRKEENAWWSLAPHDIAVACHLFEAEPVSVSASGHAYLQDGVEDVVFANMKFSNGRMAQIHVSWLDPHKIRRVTLVGSQKMVVFDDMEAAEKIRVYDKGADINALDSYADSITLRTGDILIPRTPTGEPLRTECQHFIDCIASDKTPLSDGLDGLKVVKVLEAGSESLRRGGELVQLR